MKSLIPIFLLFCAFNLEAQTSFPKGAYMSADEVRLKTPSLDVDFIIRKKNSMSNNTSEYKLISTDSLLKRKDIVDEIWAYSDGTKMYLNTIQIDLILGYSLVEHEGRYLLYLANPFQDNRFYYKKEKGEKYEHSTSTTVYALDLSDYKAMKIDKKVLRKWLEKTPDLLEQYNNAKNNNHRDVILHYAKLRNEIAAINAAKLK